MLVCACCGQEVTALFDCLDHRDVCPDCLEMLREVRELEDEEAARLDAAEQKHDARKEGDFAA